MDFPYWRGRGTSRGMRGSARGMRGSARGRSSNTPQREVRLGFKTLENMQDKTPDEITLDLTSSRCFPATEYLLNAQESMTDDTIFLLVKILARASGSDARESVLKLLNVLPQSMFFTIHLSSYLSRIPLHTRPPLSPDRLEVALKNLIKLLAKLMEVNPSCYPFLPLLALSCVVTMQCDDGTLDVDIKSRVQNLMKLRDEKVEELERKEEEKKRSRQHPRDPANRFENVAPPDNFRDLAVIPTRADINTDQKPYLRKNRTTDRYDDAEHYLDVQFRLLKEDFVRPLRDGIQQLLAGETNASKLDVRVYWGARILYPVCSSKGLMYVMKFDNSRLKRVRWENSKRLIFGSLLCLSKDNFETYIFATVEDRNVKDLQQGRVGVRFLGLDEENEMCLENNDVYQMVETTAYFEAYRHVLEGLQDVPPQQLPLGRYIVECEVEVRAPAYLRNRRRPIVHFDLRPIMKKDGAPSSTHNTVEGIRERLARQRLGGQTNNGSSVPILNLASWPSAEELELDDSQLAALQLALTKEFAVIQGPPGTGKTYIGLKIAKILLHNKDKWDTGTELVMDEDDDEVVNRPAAHRPILVVCYTNHALDQFLEGIHEYHPDGIVRVGGRSNSEKMQECSLRQKKRELQQAKAMPREIRRAFFEIHQEMEAVSHRVEEATKATQKLMENVLDDSELTTVMTAEQRRSLEEPLRAQGIKKPHLIHWLGLIPGSDPSVGVDEAGDQSKPVAVFDFSKANFGVNLVTRHKIAVSRNIKNAPGTDGVKDGSLELAGNRESFIEIANGPDGELDTQQSMTILVWVYPMGSAGPIISFHAFGLGVQIWQEDDPPPGRKAIFSASFNRRDGAQPPSLEKAVLNMNTWNFIGASYNHETGRATLWHDGKQVETVFIGAGMHLATQFPVRIGAIEDGGLCFKGRISSLKIFPRALGIEQIMASPGLGGPAPNEDEDEAGQEEEEPAPEGEEAEDDEHDADVQYEADVMADQRYLDVEDVDFFGRKGSARSLGQQPLKVADPFSSTQPPSFNEATGGGWQVQNLKGLKKKMKFVIKQELSGKDTMDEDQANQVEDVWSLSKKDRWRLYRRWMVTKSDSYKRTITQYRQQFEENARKLKEIQAMEDMIVLKKADVIGMTTTGAAKYRKLVQKIKPRITIVEEAAEVFESHIVTSLSNGCQHLILIGDHEQLKPNPTVYELAKYFSLDVSLFERMVRNGMPFARLRLQHRMRPEIACMVNHIYQDLENHESVMNFDNIRGISHNMFFVDHEEFEAYTEEGRSRSNLHEAKYIAALCRYLILQGYEREQITVLTTYTGQLIQLKQQMPRDFFLGVRVTAVDNFQGEENDIILLSLVRSNEEGRIGFLNISNRVCVALSRAKQGFYCIGNIKSLKENSGLWAAIIDDMHSQGKVGHSLKLTCQNHPQNTVEASSAEDFRQAPEGGCRLPCTARLECGHVCTKACHPVDQEHKEYKCMKPCEKRCASGHRCNKRCHADCGPCMAVVGKTMPGCGHQQNLRCSEDPADFNCLAPCPKILRLCGHPCANRCSEVCTVKCEHLVKKTWPCGHKNKTKCHVDPLLTPCKAPCGAQLQCEHQCQGTCSGCKQGRLHKPCGSGCGRTLFCGHLCPQPCTKNCPPCREKCGNSCVHSKCPKKCGEPCKKCAEPCSWRCPHFECTNLCGRPCDRPRCDAPCEKRLRCGHQCIGLCGEPCPNKCRICHEEDVTEVFFGTEEEPDARFIQLADCGHLIEVEGMDQWMKTAEGSEDGKAVDIQLKKCPKCQVPIRTSLRYGNIVKNILANMEAIKRKIHLSEVVRNQRFPEINRNLLELTEFADEVKTIRRSCDRDLTEDQLNVIENQIHFLKFLQKLKVMVENEFGKLQMESTDEEELRREIKSLKEWIMKFRLRFSEQELEEFQEELLRACLLLNYRILKCQLRDRRLDVGDMDSWVLEGIEKALAGEKPIEPAKRERYMESLDRTRTRYNLTVRFTKVTNEEKQMIVKAMQLSQGHWFKCPNGHIYCITECGGAMEEVKCPECEARIGGKNHQLRSDNQLAREMDGASYAAWSEQANLLNYEGFARH